ncbi:FAD-dependent thymidylate synthase [Sporosarcina contaminans]|uniref:FAD-dependent thymidylate synthase n=1 Tax=Sporosarcina contaminans TaxID=633403 RepID=A0ABW3TS64_9BACL
MDRLQVLDKGYVRLVGVMGSDLTIVNSARVSYDKQKAEMDSKDERLINFLIREGHTSPLRHASLQFEVYAPLMVARQWWKYVVGSDHTMDAWNESSRRYISEDEQFYIPAPTEWRSKPENSKQGSGETLKTAIGNKFTKALMQYVEEGEQLYNFALLNDIAPEQARLFLPAYGMYVRWYWTASLQSVLHFLDQRLGHDAQAEIQDYAIAVDAYTKAHFPAVHKAWQEHRK